MALLEGVNLVAEYTDPLIPMLQADVTCFPTEAVNVFNIVDNRTGRTVENGGSEAEAWRNWLIRSRTGQRPVDIAARVRVVARLILACSSPSAVTRNDPVTEHAMIEFMRGAQWQHCVLTAKAIMAMEFAPCEYDVEV